MTDKILKTKPPSPEESFLLEEYWKETVKQADRMDELARELFKLEIAIPGLYVTALKLFSNKGGRFSDWILAAFVCWALALIATLCGLTPKNYKIHENAVDRVLDASIKEGLTIREYFYEAAHWKRIFLIAASVLFFAGVFFAGLSIIY